MLNSINCSTVICSPTIEFSILREATSETYGPRVYFPSYIFISINQKPQKHLAVIYLYLISLLFYLHHISFYYFAIFTFQSIQQKYQKYLSCYLYQISLLQVAVKGLTTPLSRWLQGEI